MSAQVPRYVEALRGLLEDLLALGNTNSMGGPSRGPIRAASARFAAATRALPRRGRYAPNEDVLKLLRSLEVGSYATPGCLARREREIRALVAAAAALIAKLEPGTEAQASGRSPPTRPSSSPVAAR